MNIRKPVDYSAMFAAEYLSAAYPDVPGFSPQNLRRMREFYRAYESGLKVMAEAMSIGWTQRYFSAMVSTGCLRIFLGYL